MNQIQLVTENVTKGGKPLEGINGAAKVVLIDGATGLPYVAGSGGGGTTNGLTDAQLRAAPLSVDMGAIAGERPLLDALAITTNNNGYKYVPAGSTNLVLSGAGTGAMGDTINRIIFIVSNDAACTVTLTDGTGANGVLNAVPLVSNNSMGGTWSVDMGDLPSMDGPWKVTTGAGVSLIVIGKFS